MIGGIPMQKPLIIRNTCRDPYYNLAIEEVLFLGRTEKYVILWQNDPTVVIGRNQNAYAEINLGFVRDNGIKVVRRLTGGGAVFHDSGNLNFSYISDGDSMPDMESFLTPVVQYLRSIGQNAVFSGRNDILINGFKVSGNATAVKNGRVLVHGTLMFDVDVGVLSKALTPPEYKLKNKGIESVRSRVANISDFLEPKITVDEFSDGLFDCFCGYGFVPDLLRDEDIAQAKELAAEKYLTREWNFGENPDCAFKSCGRIGNSFAEVAFDVCGGELSNVRITGDFFGCESISTLEQALNGTEYELKAVKEKLVKCELQKFISSAKPQALVDLFFSTAK